MTRTEQQSLAHATRYGGRVILTFLKEAATELALAATTCDDPNTAFSKSQRSAGILFVLAQLEALANDETI